MERNFFKEHKILVIVFLLMALFLIGMNMYVHRGLFYNGASVFIQLLVQQEEDGVFFFYLFQKIRFFSELLLILPYNILIPFVKNTALAKCDLFVFSYNIALFLMLMANYFVAQRTKCFNIAVCAFAFYAMFYIPNSISFMQEIHIAVMLQLLLLQYFLTKEKLNIYDYIIAATTAVLCMASFENQIYLGLILFVASLFYFKKDVENKKLKMAIGISGLLMLIVPLIITFPSCKALFDFNFDVQVTLSSLFQYSLLFTTFGCICLLITSIIKRNYTFNDWKKIVLIFIILLAYTWKKTELVPTLQPEVSFYMSTFVLSILAFILFVLGDLTKKSENETRCLFSNIVLISCLIGFVQIGWQINSNLLFQKYINVFKQKIQSSDSVLSWTKAEIKKPYLVFDFCYGSEARSILLSDTKEIKSLLLSEPSVCKTANIVYDEKENILRINSEYIPIEGNYWDLNGILPKLIEYEKSNSAADTNKNEEEKK